MRWKADELSCLDLACLAWPGIRAAAVVDFRLGRWRTAGALFFFLPFVDRQDALAPPALGPACDSTCLAGLGGDDGKDQTRRNETGKGLFLFTLGFHRRK